MIGRALALAKISAGATGAVVVKVAVVATVTCLVVGVVASSVSPTTPTPATEPAQGQGDAQFLISGATAPGQLAPGASTPMELTLSNPGSSALIITSLTVAIGGVRIGTDRGECTTDNFAIRQYSGSYGFVLDGMRTVSFTELGIAAEQWPQVSMINFPVNQDACKSATVTFAFAGEAADGSA